MILKMVLGLMQSILSFVLGLLPLPDVPAWLVELTETILGYMKTGMGIVLFFVPQAVVQGALDLVILVWTVVHGYKLVMWVLRKIPMLGHRIAEGPHSSIGKRAPFVKGRQKGIGAPFVGFEVAENGRREAHSTS